MKKVYPRFRTNVLAIGLSLSLLSSVASAQICGNVVENFNATGGTTAGFSGDFSYGAGANGNLIKRNVIPNGLYTITTPTYKLLPGFNYVGFGFILGGTEKVSRVEAVITYFSTLTNQLTNVFLTQFIPTYGVGTDASVCRTVDLSELPGFPVNGRYRMRFEVTPNTGSGLTAQTITFDDFRTNATREEAALPVNFISFDGRKTSAGTQLTWKVGGEEKVDRYEVERSTDGRNFVSIGSVAVNKTNTYNYSDAANFSTAYYRIKNVDKNNKFTFSTIVRIAEGKSSIVIKAFPQPVVSQLTVQHPVSKGNGMLTISTADGRVVATTKPVAGSMQTFVNMSTLQKGMYIVRFNDGDGSTETMKVIKQ